MKNLNHKFLEFNGESIFFLNSEGQWWVAIRPICTALNVNYDRQFKNLKADPILSMVYAIQHIPDAREHTQKMLCLPEKYIYGWLFSIRSNSPELIEYKKECYDVLYNHFHGAITKLSHPIREKSASQKRLEELNKQLLANEDYKEKLALEDKIKQTNKTITAIKKEIENEQITLFDN